MLYVYFGNDITKVRSEAQKKAQELCAPGGEVCLITSEAGTVGEIKDALGATSLFRAHEVFVLDTISDDSELFETLLAVAPEMGTSHNHFVIIEGALLAGPKKVFEKHGSVCVEYKKTEKPFNAFALSDALLQRDKKTLWILLMEAWKAGRSDEELIGTLFWQLKVLRLAEVAPSAVEAGQKPFVFDKAKRALRNFKSGEVSSLMESLLLVYHDGHSGKRVTAQALEAWVLKL